MRFDLTNPSFKDDYDFPKLDLSKLDNGGIYTVVARFSGEPDMPVQAQFLKKGTTILTRRVNPCNFPAVICHEEALLRNIFYQNDGMRMDTVLADGFYTMSGRYIPDAMLLEEYAD